MAPYRLVIVQIYIISAVAIVPIVDVREVVGHGAFEVKAQAKEIDVVNIPRSEGQPTKQCIIMPHTCYCLSCVYSATCPC